MRRVRPLNRGHAPGAAVAKGYFPAMARPPYTVGLPIATALSVLPVAIELNWLCFVAAAEIAICLMLMRDWLARPKHISVLPGPGGEEFAPHWDDEPPIYAMRRIVPRLREHRPPAIVEMQLAWRGTAQARRLRRVS